MESNLKFMGEKFERNLSFHEVAKILGTSNVKILELLRMKEILFKENKRNLPYDKYLRKGWFEVSYVEVENNNFSACLPIVRITKLGFENIENILLENPDFINSHNQRTFWKSIKLSIKKKIVDLGFNVKDFNEWILKNTITYNEHGSNLFIIFTFIDSKKQILIKYDSKKKIIFENER